jgi:hypothetical protein
MLAPIQQVVSIKLAPNKISLKCGGLLFADDRAVNASFLG